ncbi:hypothetical protein ACFYNX_24400 [Streptomyces sp. NPDC007872]|uniref:hypothetical protein n=1 Tax=Streptomyces sp. NPDC007872 TaxID=3364782 RepID=UPI0036833F51
MPAATARAGAARAASIAPWHGDPIAKISEGDAGGAKHRISTRSGRDRHARGSIGSEPEFDTRGSRRPVALQWLRPGPALDIRAADGDQRHLTTGQEGRQKVGTDPIER